MDNLRREFIKASLDAMVAENPHSLMKAFDSVSGCPRTQEYNQRLASYVKSRIEC